MIILFLSLNVFGDNLLKKYDGKDATFEILGMLFGAFILGILLRHFLGFRKKEFIIEQESDLGSGPGGDGQSELGGQIKRLKIEIDRLSGISSTQEGTLLVQKNGKKTIVKEGSSQKSKQEATTIEKIPAIVALETEVLKAGKLSIKVSAKTNKEEKDNLKVLEGVGPAIERMLNEYGIFNYNQLANQTAGQLEEMLDKAGPRFRVHVPETWPEQAALLRDGKSVEFKTLTENLKGGRRM